MASLTEMLKRVLISNELGGDPNVAYRFSHARKGKSGYSFGTCQFDVKANRHARVILLDCGFSMEEVQSLLGGKPNLTALNAKLKAAKKQIDKADADHIGQTVVHVGNVAYLAGVRLSDDLCTLALCDYHNQYHLSPGGKCITHLSKLRQPVIAADVFHFALDHTQYGQNEPDDLRRRHGNIVRIYEEMTGA